MKFLIPLSLLFLCVCVPVASRQSHFASGMVLQTDPVRLSLKISCQAIPGYMDSMVKRVRVRDVKLLQGLEPGMLINFLLREEGDSAYTDDITVHRYENTAQEPMTARQLELLEAATEVRLDEGSRLQPRQVVPDFTLIDQNRENVTLSQFRGKLVALTFIYTRCPLPNFCFRMSNNFGVLHRRFAQQMGKELVLLSVTFDPEHDQPETLAEYARTWTKDANGWHFLTGSPAQISRICREVGMTSWQDEGLMTHSLHTVIVDRQGRIAANLEGNEYTAQQLTDLIDVFLSGAS